MVINNDNNNKNYNNNKYYNNNNCDYINISV